MLAVKSTFHSAAFLFLAGIAALVRGEIIHVPLEAPTIQAGLDSLDVGDTVTVAVGVYAEALIAPPFHFVLLGDVVPDSGDYPRPIIDPSSLPDADSLTGLFLPEGSSATIEDFVFHNGPEMYPHILERPGGVFSYGNSITVRRCLFDSTNGAFYHWPLNPGPEVVDSLSDCVFRNIHGNGVSQLDDPVIASNCRFLSGNCYSLCVAGRGSRIRSCTFGNNPGGSLLILLGNDTEVSGCTFGPSTVSSQYLLRLGQDTVNVVVQNNTFIGNEVTQAVVEAQAYASQAFLIENNLFLDNNASADSATCLRAGPYYPSFVRFGGIIRGNVFQNCFGQASGANVGESNGDNLWFGNHFVETSPDPGDLPVLRVTQGDSTVLRNNLFINTGFALSSSAPTVDAVLNWWNDPTGPYHATQNPGGLGDTLVGEVTFVPWYSDTSFLASPGLPAPLPQQVSLAVFPNPFNATATLTLTVNRPGIFEVTLFNLLGQRAQEIWSGAVASEKRISLDGSALASGLYFVRVWQPIQNRPAALEKIAIIK